MAKYLNIFLIYRGVEDKYWDSTNTGNCENEEIAKSLCHLYEVHNWVAVTFGKISYPGEVK